MNCVDCSKIELNNTGKSDGSMNKIKKYFAIFISLICVPFIGTFFSACKNEKYIAIKYRDVAYGEHDRQNLNLYLPEEKSGDVGLILMIHGGAWVAGDKGDYADEMNKWCTIYGYATASINYHYISEDFHCDDIMNDIGLALDKIKETALNENDININKVMLMGISAGAHLSLLYSYKYADVSPIKPVAVVDYSGVGDLTDNGFYSSKMLADNDWYFNLFSQLTGVDVNESNYLTAEVQEKLLEVSPINFINENTVPTLICHAVEDNIVPYSNAITLRNRLKDCNVKYNLVTFNNSGHSLGHDKKHKKEANKLFEKYVKNYL